MMHEGLNRARVSNDSSVRALWASSMMTSGRHSRNTFASECGIEPSSRFSSMASKVAVRPVKWCDKAPDGSYTFRPSVSSTRRAASVETMMTVSPSKLLRWMYKASVRSITRT